MLFIMWNKVEVDACIKKEKGCGTQITNSVLDPLCMDRLNNRFWLKDWYFFKL
jgi:hypothetical protein